MKLFGYEFSFKKVVPVQQVTEFRNWKDEVVGAAVNLERRVVEGITDLEHKAVGEVTELGHDVAEGGRKLEAEAKHLASKLKSDVANDITQIKGWCASISAKLTMQAGNVAELKGIVMTTQAQLVTALNTLTTETAKFKALLDDRDTRIKELEQALISPDKPVTPDIEVALKAAQDAFNAVMADAIKPPAVDNTATPPVLNTPA